MEHTTSVARKTYGSASEMLTEPYKYLMHYGLFHAVVIFSGSLVVGLDIGEFKSIMVLLVES